jgi:hypothetical protein
MVSVTMPRAAAHLRQPACGQHGTTPVSGARVHTKETFAFKARGTMSDVAPMFGAEKERLWAADWDPQFVHPYPAADEQGMVFAVDRHENHEMWVNTEFDVKNGRINYVYVIPEALVTVITLRLTPLGEDTGVDVMYERTSLSPEADARVRQMAEGDRRAGPDWQKAVNAYLAKPNR